jgi:hypothetical protein
MAQDHPPLLHQLDGSTASAIRSRAGASAQLIKATL